MLMWEHICAQKSKTEVAASKVDLALQDGSSECRNPESIDWKDTGYIKLDEEDWYEFSNNYM